MSKPLPDELSNAQLTTILSAASPLPIDAREAFLADVADALTGLPLGDGTVFQIVREVQRKHFDPPNFKNDRPPRTL